MAATFVPCRRPQEQCPPQENFRNKTAVRRQRRHTQASDRLALGHQRIGRHASPRTSAVTTRDRILRLHVSFLITG